MKSNISTFLQRAFFGVFHIRQKPFRKLTPQSVDSKGSISKDLPPSLAGKELELSSPASAACPLATATGKG